METSSELGYRETKDIRRFDGGGRLNFHTGSHNASTATLWSASVVLMKRSYFISKESANSRNVFDTLVANSNGSTCAEIKLHGGGLCADRRVRLHTASL